MSASVLLNNVVKTHGANLAVDHVSLAIQEGEFFSILGPSGSGKTTLLRLIAGLDIPDSGEVDIQGQRVTSHPPHERPVNMVFQQYALFPHLSVSENVAFGLKMQKRPPSEILKTVDEMLELVRLQGKAHRLPSQLSGGEQQRVALARALVNRPVVLLLDEPLAALDQQLREEMQGELKRLQKEVRATFICVTHQQEEALMLSDRLAMMHNGKILQVGTPQHMYEKPVSTTVARFIGQSNFLLGTVDRLEKGLLWVHHPSFPKTVVQSPSANLGPGPITVMVRPEQVHLCADRADPRFDNTLQGTVEEIVFNGNDVLYQIRLSGDLRWTARRSVLDAAASPFQVDQSVFLQWFANSAIALSS